MIKLFRNTRRKLLAENKFSKYLAYAIGEIFLVVVGILIALWINNANQESINEQKAEVILKEIQRDLKKDIEGSKAVINRFITHDSIAKLLLWDKLTADQMFELNEFKSYGIVYYSITFETSNNGYVNFKRNLNNIPTKYDAITNKLKDLYDITGVAVEVANERMVSTVHGNLDKANTFDWNVESIKRGITEEGKNYYMQDLEFKKTLLNYMHDITKVFLTTETYRLQAIRLHNKISEILNSDDMLPYPSHLNTALNTLDQKPILGTYKLKETMSESFPPIIELSSVDNFLNIILANDYQFKYYLFDETTFLSPTQYADFQLNNIKFTKSKNIAFYISIGKSAYAYYTKIED